MTDNVVAFDFNGVKVVRDSNTKLKMLYAPKGATTETLHDVETGADYQVPTGKKFKVIYLETLDQFTAGKKIHYADDADGTTNAVTLVAGFAAASTYLQTVIFISGEAPADKYINAVKSVSADDIVIFGVEENA